MRFVVFAFVLLHAVAGVAQITIGDEVVSDPLLVHSAPLYLAAPAASMAKDRTGVALAWSMPNDVGLERIYVARLDSSAHVVGAVREMPVSQPAYAVYPSLAPAPGGDGFVLGWLELERDMPSKARDVFCRLDAALTPSAPTVLFPAVPPLAPVIVRTKGDTAWISADGFLWSLAQDGTLDGGPFAGLIASDMTVANNVPLLVGGRTTKGTSYSCQAGCLIGHFPGLTYCPDQCRIYPVNYSLDFAAFPTSAMSKTFKFDSAAQPAVESNGNDVLVAWFRGTQSSGGDVVVSGVAAGDFLRFGDAADHPTVLGTFTADTGETRPDIATDGQRYVAVWRIVTSPGNHDIVGMAIDNDGKRMPLSIATSSADERDPAILDLGGGTFLVAYEKMTGTERRIAGRFVTFGRHRAAR